LSVSVSTTATTIIITSTTGGPNGRDKEASCQGHSKDDVLIWKNLVDDDNSAYTNAELYDIMNPAVDAYGDYRLPYVYDEFKWAHCAKLGYPETLFDDSGPDDETG
jgi:hypothetical protein